MKRLGQPTRRQVLARGAAGTIGMVLAFAIALPGPGRAAERDVSLADSLPAKAGLTRGVAALPRSGDGKLAMALAGSGRFLVHAMDADRKHVAALAEAADAAGLLARRLYVEQGTAAAMPLADNSVDLVLITDLADADLASLPQKEVLRVLSPLRGQAIVGRARLVAGSGTLSQAALEAWAKGFAVADAKVEEIPSGLWLSVRKPLPPGSDPWTHRYHGPDNNLASQDTTLQPPLVTQWLGLPMHEGWWGTAIVSAGGRLYTIWAARSPRERHQHSLTARSLHNGTLLWQRPFKVEPGKVSYNAARCCMIAAADCLYLIDGDGVLVLDGETGAERGRLAGPEPGGQIKWFALADGVLAMLVGEADQMIDTNIMAYPTNPQGKLLAAYDPATGRQLWRHEEGKPIDERMVAVHAGRLYAYCAGARAFALDLKTGKLRWANAESAMLALLDPINKQALAAAILSQHGLVALDQALVVGAHWHPKRAVLSPETGAVLFDMAQGKWGRTVRGFALDGKWWAQGGERELATGQRVAGKGNVPGDGCGPSICAPGLVIGGFGRCTEIASNKTVARDEVKAPCDMGTLVSEGLIVTPPSQCRCNYETWGYRAITSGQGMELDRGSDAAGRLVVGSQERPAPLEVSPADWPTYRANVARTGATPVKVPPGPASCWRWSPAVLVEFEPSPLVEKPARTTFHPEHSPTPPIAAAGRVWFGDAAGTVRCLDAASGKLLWSYATPTRLFAPPSLADGRLYVGGGDGWVYCLDASAGRELWRFHAAPRQRRILCYGHLVDTWPVAAGVLVHDGVAYAAAGYQSLNGIHVYALDAVTGQVRWENHEAGRFNSSSGGSGVRGTMAIARGRLWLAGASNWPASFDLNSGAMEPVKTEQKKLVGWQWKPPLRGGEVGAMGNRYVVYGGRRSSSGYDERKNPGRTTGFSLLRLTDDGTSEEPEVHAIPESTLPPVWDAELTVVTRFYNDRLEGWSTPKLTSFVEQRVSKAGMGRVAPSECASPRWSKTSVPSPMHAWEGPKWEFSASVLAADAVLVAHAVAPTKTNAAWTWALSALRRTTGETLWSRELPSEPIFNGLCVDRQGQVLVAMRDGSVLCFGVSKTASQ